MTTKILTTAFAALFAASISAQSLCPELKAAYDTIKFEHRLKDYFFNFSNAGNAKAEPLTYLMVFNKGHEYQFHLEYGNSPKGAAVVELSDSQRFLGGTYAEQKNKHYKTFNFYCMATGVYEIKIRSKDGFTGCGFLSVIAGRMADAPAQTPNCDPKLFDALSTKSSDDEQFLKDFKTYLPEGASEEVFKVILNKETTYGFRWVNSDKFQGRAKVVLTDEETKTICYPTASQTQGTDNNFRFKCPKTGVYQLKVSYPEQKEGCSVIFLSYIAK